MITSQMGPYPRPYPSKGDDQVVIDPVDRLRILIL